jgi:acetyltransferase
MTNLHAHPAVVPIRRTGLAAPSEIPIADFASHYCWHEALHDGTQVVIRPMTKDDAARERAFLEHLSPESLHFRFLGEVRVTDRLVRKLVDVDRMREAAFVAMREGRDEQIGAGRFCTTRDGTSCECAVVVSDKWQGKGLGYMLMRHLIEVARQAGIKRIFSIDSAQNHSMRRLATDLGFRHDIDSEFPSEIVFSLQL